MKNLQHEGVFHIPPTLDKPWSTACTRALWDPFLTPRTDLADTVCQTKCRIYHTESRYDGRWEGYWLGALIGLLTEMCGRATSHGAAPYQAGASAGAWGLARCRWDTNLCLWHNTQIIQAPDSSC